VRANQIAEFSTSR